MAKILNYSGKALDSKQTFTDKKGNFHELEAYLPSDDLKDAVNLSIQLKRPLLIMGEPGCGKTRLAEAVAYELHKEKVYNHYFRWNIKSTTKAKDGIYQYDALKRLYHVNLKIKDSEQVEDIENYISYGKLAKAFTSPQNEGLPNVLLIDEIDKADIDFPNDLLLELDTKTFAIPELGEEGELKASSEVIIFITSNQEKELPAAFLRRCLFHYINFPDKQKLTKIVGNYVESVDDKIIDKALEIFIKDIRENLSESDKKPSTSELIDWFEMIELYTRLRKEKPESVDRTESENRLVKQLDLIDVGRIPFRQVLLKTVESMQTMKNDEEI